MKIFVTGATGFVGSQVTQELVASGYEVTGLARSDKSAAKLVQWGATPIRGSLSDLSVLAQAANDADAIIHLGFVNDFRHFYRAGKTDQQAIEAMANAIAGTNKPLVITYGTSGVRRSVLTEDQPTERGAAKWYTPRKSEVVARKLIAEGFNAFVVRLSPSVHGQGDQGFIKMFLDRAKEQNVSDYLSIGQHNWSAVHRLDAAHLFCLVVAYGLEHPTTSNRIFNAVAEESIPQADIALAISQKIGVPVAATRNPLAFGSLAALSLLNCPASNEITRRVLNWQPTQPTLIEDLMSSAY